MSGHTLRPKTRAVRIVADLRSAAAEVDIELEAAIVQSLRGEGLTSLSAVKPPKRARKAVATKSGVTSAGTSENSPSSGHGAPIGMLSEAGTPALCMRSRHVSINSSDATSSAAPSSVKRRRVSFAVAAESAASQVGCTFVPDANTVENENVQNGRARSLNCEPTEAAGAVNRRHSAPVQGAKAKPRRGGKRNQAVGTPADTRSLVGMFASKSTRSDQQDRCDVIGVAFSQAPKPGSSEPHLMDRERVSDFAASTDAPRDPAPCEQLMMNAPTNRSTTDASNEPDASVQLVVNAHTSSSASTSVGQDDLCIVGTNFVSRNKVSCSRTSNGSFVAETIMVAEIFNAAVAHPSDEVHAASEYAAAETGAPSPIFHSSTDIPSLPLFVDSQVSALQSDPLPARLLSSGATPLPSVAPTVVPPLPLSAAVDAPVTPTSAESANALGYVVSDILRLDDGATQLPPTCSSEFELQHSATLDAFSILRHDDGDTQLAGTSSSQPSIATFPELPAFYRSPLPRKSAAHRECQGQTASTGHVGFPVGFSSLHGADFEAAGHHGQECGRDRMRPQPEHEVHSNDWHAPSASEEHEPTDETEHEVFVGNFVAEVHKDGRDEVQNADELNEVPPRLPLSECIRQCSAARAQIVQLPAAAAAAVAPSIDRIPEANHSFRRLDASPRPIVSGGVDFAVSSDACGGTPLRLRVPLTSISACDPSLTAMEMRESRFATSPTVNEASTSCSSQPIKVDVVADAARVDVLDDEKISMALPAPPSTVRLAVSQVGANSPIEDRWFAAVDDVVLANGAAGISAAGGTVADATMRCGLSQPIIVGVADGHGGDLCSAHVRDFLPAAVFRRTRRENDPARIARAIQVAFDEVDERFCNTVVPSAASPYVTSARPVTPSTPPRSVGACVVLTLIRLVRGVPMMFTASAGDSQAVLGRWTPLCTAACTLKAGIRSCTHLTRSDGTTSSSKVTTSRERSGHALFASMYAAAAARCAVGTAEKAEAASNVLHPVACNPLPPTDTAELSTRDVAADSSVKSSRIALATAKFLVARAARRSTRTVGIDSTASGIPAGRAPAVAPIPIPIDSAPQSSDDVRLEAVRRYVLASCDLATWSATSCRSSQDTELRAQICRSEPCHAVRLVSRQQSAEHHAYALSEVLGVLARGTAQHPFTCTAGPGIPTTVPLQAGGMSAVRRIAEEFGLLPSLHIAPLRFAPGVLRTLSEDDVLRAANASACGYANLTPADRETAQRTELSVLHHIAASAVDCSSAVHQALTTIIANAEIAMGSGKLRPLLQRNACHLRLAGSLAPTRALGDAYLKTPASYGVPPLLIATPVVRARILTEGDAFCVVASDGLWDHVGPGEAAATVATALVDAAFHVAEHEQRGTYSDNTMSISHDSPLDSFGTGLSAFSPISRRRNDDQSLNDNVCSKSSAGMTAPQVAHASCSVPSKPQGNALECATMAANSVKTEADAFFGDAAQRLIGKVIVRSFAMLRQKPGKIAEVVRKEPSLAAAAVAASTPLSNASSSMAGVSKVASLWGSTLSTFIDMQPGTGLPQGTMRRAIHDDATAMVVLLPWQKLPSRERLLQQYRNLPRGATQQCLFSGLSASDLTDDAFEAVYEAPGIEDAMRHAHLPLPQPSPPIALWSAAVIAADTDMQTAQNNVADAYTCVANTTATTNALGATAPPANGDSVSIELSNGPMKFLEVVPSTTFGARFIGQNDNCDEGRHTRSTPLAIAAHDQERASLQSTNLDDCNVVGGNAIHSHAPLSNAAALLAAIPSALSVPLVASASSMRAEVDFGGTASVLRGQSVHCGNERQHQVGSLDATSLAVAVCQSPEVTVPEERAPVESVLTAVPITLPGTCKTVGGPENHVQPRDTLLSASALPTVNAPVSMSLRPDIPVWARNLHPSASLRTLVANGSQSLKIPRALPGTGATLGRISSKHAPRVNIPNNLTKSALRGANDDSGADVRSRMIAAASRISAPTRADARIASTQVPIPQVKNFHARLNSMPARSTTSASCGHNGTSGFALQGAQHAPFTGNNLADDLPALLSQRGASVRSQPVGSTPRSLSQSIRGMTSTDYEHSKGFGSCAAGSSVTSRVVQDPQIRDAVDPISDDEDDPAIHRNDQLRYNAASYVRPLLGSRQGGTPY